MKNWDRADTIKLLGEVFVLLAVGFIFNGWFSLLILGLFFMLDKKIAEL